MPTRTDEIFRLLGISENTQPGPAKTTSRQAEIENILSFMPSIRQKKQTAEFPQPAAPLKGELSGAENNGLTSDSDVGAALAVARPHVSPAGETEPLDYDGGGTAGGGSGRGTTVDSTGFSGTSGSFAKPESQNGQRGAAAQTRQEPALPEKTLTAADYDRLIREKEAELARWEAWDYDATSTRERQEYDNGIKAYENQIESLKAAKWKAEKEEQYGALKNNADYETRSFAEQEKPTAGFGIGWGTSWWGKGDPVYDYINDIDGTREKWINPATMGHSPYSIYDYMNEDEIKTYNYLYNTDGKESAGKYLDYIEYALNDRSTKQIAQSVADMADKHPVASSAASIPTNLVSGMGLADVAWQNLKRELTGEYVPIDYNRGVMAPSVMTSAIRGTVAQNIADSTGVIHLDEEEHPHLSKIFNGKSLGDVYQLGMSVADSMTVAYLTPLGKYGSVLLGGSAGTQGILDALEQGATDGQALKMGLLNAAFESLFEYVSLDKLLTSEPKSLILALLKQGGVEASEEVMTTFANNIADILVMAEKSDYQLKIQGYMESGMSREEATKQALLDKCIELGWDAVGGFFSGGISGGVNYGINTLGRTQTKAQTQAQSPQLPENLDSSAASPAVKPLNIGQQTEETEQYIAALRKPGESDTINEKDRKVALALELAAQGKTPSQIYQETGLVTKANGDIMDGFGGEVIWRKNGQQRISDEGVTGSQEGRSTQTEVSGDDGRGDAGGLLPQSGRKPYASLTEQQRDRARDTIIRRLHESGRQETLILLEEFGDDAELTRRIYNDYVIGNVALEQWASVLGDIEGLSRELDEILSPGGQEGSPLGGAVTQSVTEGGTTAAARQQQYQTEIAAALEAGDYQQALNLFKEYGNPNLRAMNEVQTLISFEDFFQSAGMDKIKSFGEPKDNIKRPGKAEANGRFLNKSEKLYQYAPKIKPIDGFEDFICHADPYTFYIDMAGEGKEKDFIEFSPADYAEAIRNSKTYRGGNIRLISCQAGAIENGAAQQVADTLQVIVMAPTEIVNVDENGEMFLTDNEILAEIWYDADREESAKIKETGKWLTFYPRKE